MIDIYGSKLMDLITHMQDASAICHEVNLCASQVPYPSRKRSKVTPTRKPSMVGVEKCTYGPSHWCANEANAKNCGGGAVRFCQEKVWLGKAPKA